MVSSNTNQLTIAPESTWGTPSTTNTDYLVLRQTQNSLQRNRTTSQSQILVADRSTDSYIETDLAAGGDIQTEFHFDNAIEFLMRSALYSAAFPSPGALMADTASIQVTFTGATGAIVAASGTPFATVSVGDWIVPYNTGDADKDGLPFKVISKASSVSITVAGKAAFADKVVASGGAGDNCVLYKPSAITNGSTHVPFTSEVRYGNTGSLFSVFPGCTPTSWGLNAATGGNGIQMSLSVLAKNEDIYPSTISPGNEAPPSTGTGWTAAGTNSPFSGIATTGFLLAATPTVGASNAFVASAWGFTLNNNLRTENTLFTLGASGVNAGQLVIEGTMEAYYSSANHALRVYTKDFTTRAMVFSVLDLEGNRYVLDFPSAKFLSDPTITPATNNDVKLSINWGVVKSATEAVMMRVVKIPANLYT